MPLSAGRHNDLRLVKLAKIHLRRLFRSQNEPLNLIARGQIYFFHLFPNPDFLYRKRNLKQLRLFFIIEVARL